MDLDGVLDAKVDVFHQIATVTFDPEKIELVEIIRALEWGDSYEDSVQVIGHKFLK